MPAPPLYNTLEGGSDTTTISAANSGGGSGNAFSTVVVGSGVTLTYSVTQSHKSVLGMKLVQPATPALTYVDWTGLGSLTGNFYTRFYLYLAALPSATTYINTVRTSADVGCAFLRINVTTGFIEAANAAQSGIAASTGSVAVATNQWIRIESRIVASTTVGQFEWRLFNNADSTVASDTVSVSSQVLGANIDKTRLGQPVAATFVTSQTLIFDDWEVSTENWIGPTGTPRVNMARRA